MSLRQILLLLSLATPVVAHAATEFTNGMVPLDLARQFAGGAVYRSLPDGFPVVTLPAGIDVRLVGSLQRGATKEALLGTSGSVESLRAALVNAYVAAGWTDASSGGLGVVCHETQGFLVFATAGLDFHGLRVAHTPTFAGSNQTCSKFMEARGSKWPAYLFGLMPVLDVPPGTYPPRPLSAPYRSVSTAGDSTGTRIEMAQDSQISVPSINVAGLYAHFAARLQEQGWQNDSEDSGTTSASSVWHTTKTPPDFAEESVTDTELTAIMTILHIDDDVYQVLFKLRAKTNAVFATGNYLDVRDFVEIPPNDPQLGIRGIPSGYYPGASCCR